MAQQLWFLRHGEAEPHDARPDADRRLTPRGEEQSRAAGRALAALDVSFQLVLSSPRVRALDTARLACEELGHERVVIDDALSADFAVDDALAAAGGDDKRVLFVGHNPDFVQVVHELTDGAVDMKKGGIAGVRMRAARRGELLVLLRPREIRLIAGRA